MAYILLLFGFLYHLDIVNGMPHFGSFRSVKDDGQSLKEEYYFTNFFPPSSSLSFFFLLLLFKKGALIKTHRLYSSLSHVVQQSQ